MNFDEALNDEYYISVINFVGNRYIGRIPRDDLEQLKLLGLWRACENYNPECGTQFVTTLYNHVRGQCLNFITKANRERKHVGSKPLKHCSLIDKNLGSVDIMDTLNMIPEKYSKAIKQKYYHNMTLTEIGQKNGYTYETARKHTNMGIQLLKQLENENRDSLC